MPSRAQVLASAILALGCARCSLLLYNDDELAAGAPPATPDGGADFAVEESSANDASSVADAAFDAGADARISFPDAAVVWSGNGHAYEVVVDEIDWYTAKTAAEKRGGHLVTITTSAENLFVFELAEPVDKAWDHVPGDTLILGPWIGCIQAPGSSEPSGGFGWVTGEPFVYDKFGENQPDNADGENACHFYAYGQRAQTWNDNFATKVFNGYVVEYE